MDLQNFNFQDNEIRTVMLDGATWFCGSDVASTLGYKIPKDAIRQHCRPKGAVKHRLLTKGGKQNLTFINEPNLYRLITKSKLPAAEKFENWIFEEVLPTIRKQGYYDAQKSVLLKQILLDVPSEWKKTFPDEFFHGVHKLYGHKFSRTIGTYSFVGKFINRYVYNHLLRGLEIELKHKRQLVLSDTKKLHQFIEENAKDRLKKHITQIEALLQVAMNAKHFEQMFEKLHCPNQLSMRLLN